MKIENENNISKHNPLSGDKTPVNNENDEDIIQLTNRKDMLNTVLEKLIDKINEPKAEQKSKQEINKQNNNS